MGFTLVLLRLESELIERERAVCHREPLVGVDGTALGPSLLLQHRVISLAQRTPRVEQLAPGLARVGLGVGLGLG